MRGLDGKRIIVTGAASGIGRAIARRLGEEGAVVGVFDINGPGAEEVANGIKADNGMAHAHEVDVTSYEAVKAGVEAFEAEAGPVDGLVNNAGWDLAEPFLDSEPETWEKVIGINLYGPIQFDEGPGTPIAAVMSWMQYKEVADAAGIDLVKSTFAGDASLLAWAPLGSGASAPG